MKRRTWVRRLRVMTDASVSGGRGRWWAGALATGVLAVAAVVLVVLVGALAGGVPVVQAQSGPVAGGLSSNPLSPECVCSAGVNIGTESAPVMIRHCQCGVLSCAVVVGSGQLQCAR